MAVFDKQDTYNKVVTVIAEKLHKDLSVIHGSSTLQDLGADSLDMAEIVIKLEEQLNIEINDEQAEKLNTVDDVVNYVHTLRKQ